MRSVKLTDAIFRKTTTKKNIRRAAKAIFQISIIYCPRATPEITDEWTLKEWMEVPVHRAMGKLQGTAFYVGKGLCVTNAHVLAWPRNLFDNEFVEVRMYASHGGGILEKTFAKRTRISIQHMPESLEAQLVEKGNAKLLPPGVKIQPTQGDWAIIKLGSEIPKDKYALLPQIERLSPRTTQWTPCSFLGVNGPDAGTWSGHKHHLETPEGVENFYKTYQKLLPGTISSCEGHYLCLDDYEFYHDISALGGSSGSPILAVDTAGDLREDNFDTCCCTSCRRKSFVLS